MFVFLGSVDWQVVCRRASKVVTFIDLAGHEKYLKTTIFGMTGHLPDFSMLMVCIFQEDSQGQLANWSRTFH